MSDSWCNYLLALIAFLLAIVAHIRIDNLDRPAAYKSPVGYRSQYVFCVSDAPAVKGQSAFASIRTPGNCSPYFGGGPIGQYSSDAQAGSFVPVQIMIVEAK